MLLGEFDHRGVDLDLGEALDRFVLEHFFGDAAVPASDDQHLAGLAVGEDRHMGHHLVVDELVLGGDLGGAVQHQHLAEERVLEQNQVLMLGLHLVEHPLDLVGHAEAEIVGRSSFTSTRLALKASRSTGMQASGSALPHMNTSSAA